MSNWLDTDAVDRQRGLYRHIAFAPDPREVRREIELACEREDAALQDLGGPVVYWQEIVEAMRDVDDVTPGSPSVYDRWRIENQFYGTSPERFLGVRR